MLKKRLWRNGHGDSASSLATLAADITLTPKQKQKAPAPIQVDTPHNTATVQSHVVAVLDKLDSLAVQGIPSDHRGWHIVALRTWFNCITGIPISTPTRNRVLQLGKSARMLWLVK